MKQSEIVLLGQMARQVGQDSYLASLLNPDLIAWVAAQIRDDFPPDIWAAFQHEQRLRVEAQGEVAGLRRQIEQLMGMLQTERRSRSDDMASVTAHLDELRAKLASVGRTYSDLAERYGDQAAALEAARAEITRLKAELYDRIVASQG